MNLPEQAIDFLPFVLQCIKEFVGQKIFRSVMIYLHYFGHKEHTDTKDLTKNTELMNTIHEITEQVTTSTLKVVFCTPRILRVVSPSKTHFVIDLKLNT